MDIDPAIAAQMGFSSFGFQPSTKKRRFHPSADDAVTSTSTSSCPQKPQLHARGPGNAGDAGGGGGSRGRGSGSNRLALGRPRPRRGGNLHGEQRARGRRGFGAGGDDRGGGGGRYRGTFRDGADAGGNDGFGPGYVDFTPDASPASIQGGAAAAAAAAAATAATSTDEIPLDLSDAESHPDRKPTSPSTAPSTTHHDAPMLIPEPPAPPTHETPLDLSDDDDDVTDLPSAPDDLPTARGKLRCHDPPPPADWQGRDTFVPPAAYQAFRRGVRNAEGDLAIFHRDMIEDPWAGWMATRAEKGGERGGREGRGRGGL